MFARLDHNITGAILSLIPLHDLARLAQSCRSTAATVRAEIYRRIGPHNHALAMSSTAAVDMSDLANFALKVTDPAAYYPLARKLLSLYDGADYYYVHRDNWGNKKECWVFSMQYLYSVWLHLGLPTCTHLIDIEFHSHRYPTCKMHPQEQLYYKILDMMSDYRDGSTRYVREWVDMLDAAHFNMLLKQMTYDLFLLQYSDDDRPYYPGFSYGYAIVKEIIWSNDVNPRYVSRGDALLDKYFVQGPALPLDPGPSCDCSRVVLHTHRLAPVDDVHVECGMPVRNFSY